MESENEFKHIPIGNQGFYICVACYKFKPNPEEICYAQREASFSEIEVDSDGEEAN
tara:strand:- start:1926 stop:2093 length:168 start_codon:yes stop_codon:yes gene_type:complete